MFLIKAKTKIDEIKTINDSCYIQKLRQTEKVITSDRIKTGGYYIYKEKYGIVALVKVLKDMSHDGWTGFRIVVKRVLYSPWPVPQNTILEIGFSNETNSYPSSWHFEPGMMLLKSEPHFSGDANTNTAIESAL